MKAGGDQWSPPASRTGDDASALSRRSVRRLGDAAARYRGRIAARRRSAGGVSRPTHFTHRRYHAHAQLESWDAGDAARRGDGRRMLEGRPDVDRGDRGTERPGSRRRRDHLRTSRDHGPELRRPKPVGDRQPRGHRELRGLALPWRSTGQRDLPGRAILAHRGRPRFTDWRCGGRGATGMDLAVAGTGWRRLRRCPFGHLRAGGGGAGLGDDVS